MVVRTLSFVPAQKPTPALDRYDNGQLRFEGFYLESEMHGPWTFYRRDGSVMRTGRFERGRQVGKWQTFDRTGAVVKDTVFAD
jgi:antitoxin component YwqK of YwqJK toxin-antitoxin module